MLNARVRGPTCRKEPRYNAFVLFLSLAVTLFLQVPPLVGVAMQTPAPQDAGAFGAGPRQWSRRDLDLARRHHGGAVQRQSPRFGRQLPQLRQGRLLPGDRLPPRRERIRGPGRRLYRRPWRRSPRARRSRTKPPTACATSAARSPWRAPRACAARRRSSTSTSSNNQDLDHQGFSPERLRLRRLRPRALGDGRRRPHRRVPTHSSAGMDDVPVEPVMIKGVKVVR